VAHVVNPDELAELEEQRTFLVRSLDDIERELAAGDLDALDADTLRADYTRRLDDVERAIETGRATMAAARPPRRRGRTAVLVGLVAVVALGAGIAVANTAGSRRPGESSTGSIRESSADRLRRAESLLQDGKVVDALKIYDAILEDDPKNVDALVGRGLALVRTTMATDQPEFAVDGQRYLEQALAIDPDNPVTHFYLAVALRVQGKDDESRAAVDAALALDPPAALRQQMEQFRASIGQ